MIKHGVFGEIGVMFVEGCKITAFTPVSGRAMDSSGASQCSHCGPDKYVEEAVFVV